MTPPLPAPAIAIDQPIAVQLEVRRHDESDLRLAVAVVHVDLDPIGVMAVNPPVRGVEDDVGNDVGETGYALIRSIAPGTGSPTWPWPRVRPRGRVRSPSAIVSSFSSSQELVTATERQASNRA